MRNPDEVLTEYIGKTSIIFHIGIFIHSVDRSIELINGLIYEIEETVRILTT